MPLPLTADKNKPVYAHFFEEEREIVNGKVVKDRAVESDYNGEMLHIDKRNNNHISHIVIKDTRLKNFLLRPTSKLNLLERLRLDYGKNKTKKHIHTKHKRSKHKRSKHKRSKHKRSKH